MSCQGFLRSIVVLSALFLGAVANSWAEEAPTAPAAIEKPAAVTIGFIPGGDVEGTKRGALLIAEAVQQELKIPVNVYLSRNYASLIEAMKEKKVDFAFFNAVTFVLAEKKAGAKVLLKKVWNEPYYYSMILVKKSSGITSLKALKGKKIAFVDEDSSSGYLYPLQHLKKVGMELKDFKAVEFTGSHSESVTLLDHGKVDAIAVFSNDKRPSRSAYVKYSKIKNPGNEIRVLWTSPQIPNDPFCVRQDFYDHYTKLTHELMFALIDIVDKLKDKKEIQDFVGAKGFVPATTRQYDSVREIVKELNLKLE
jgi:phosphonate transport system substrate-binding protein